MAKNRHWGITVLGVLGYIGAALTLLAGIAMLAGSAAISSVLAAAIPQFGGLSGLGTAMFIFLGIVFIAVAVLDYFIAKGLLSGQNWARILILIFSGLGAVQSLFALPLSIANLAVSILIIWYLGFYKPAIAYFK